MRTRGYSSDSSDLKIHDYLNDTAIIVTPPHEKPQPLPNGH